MNHDITHGTWDQHKTWPYLVSRSPQQFPMLIIRKVHHTLQRGKSLGNRILLAILDTLGKYFFFLIINIYDVVLRVHRGCSPRVSFLSSPLGQRLRRSLQCINSVFQEEKLTRRMATLQIFPSIEHGALTSESTSL